MNRHRVNTRKRRFRGGNVNVGATAPVVTTESENSAITKVWKAVTSPFSWLASKFNTTRKNSTANSATAAGTPSNATKVNVKYPVPLNAVAVNVVEKKPASAPALPPQQNLSVGGRRRNRKHRKATKKQRKH